MRIRVLKLLLVAGVLAAVPAVATAVQRPSSTPQLLPHNHVIYVSVSNAVVIYPEDGGSRPIGRITDGVLGPRGLAVDVHGTLFVANETANDVTVYAAGSKHPSMVISQGLSGPTAVGVAPSGQIYVGDTTGAVQIYAPSGGAPIGSYPSIGSGYYGPDFANDMAFDRAGNIFVTYFHNDIYSDEWVYEYPLGLAPPTLLQNTEFDVGFSIDIARGGSIVLASPATNSQDSCICTVPYRPSGPKGLFDKSGLRYPVWAKLNESESRAFVVDAYPTNITIFDYLSGRPIRLIPHVGRVNGLAVSPANVL